MSRIVASVSTLEQHVDGVKQTPQIYRPRSCPHCGVKSVWQHGCYTRKADRRAGGEGSLNPVPILRYRCSGCRRTCSRLPRCIAPRRWYDWSVQQGALDAVLQGFSPHQCARDGGPRAAQLDALFWHRVSRLVRKDGTVSYQGTRFEVAFELVGKTVRLVVDPHAETVLGVENEHGEAIGRATPLDALANLDRRRRKSDPAPAAASYTGTREASGHRSSMPPRGPGEWRG